MNITAPRFAAAFAAASVGVACGGSAPAALADRSANVPPPAPTPAPPGPPTAVLVVEVASGQGAVHVEGTSAGAAVATTCAPRCELTLDAGSRANIAAAPAQGWLFDSWDGACAGAQACSVQMTGPASVAARFRQGPLPPVPALVFDVRDLSRLGGPDAVTDAQALDETGAIAGRICDAPPLCSSLRWDVFLWDGGLQRFSVAQGRAPAVRAVAAGRVAGTFWDGQRSHAFVSEAQDLIELPTLGGDSSVRAVDAAGTVAGSSTTAAGARHAVLWKQGKLVDLASRTGMRESEAMAIDASGTVAVLACDRLAPAAGCHALLLTDDTVADLGTLPAALAASAMSAAGAVAGFLPGQRAPVAAVWSDGVTDDLGPEISARAWPALGAQPGSSLQSALFAVGPSGDAVGSVTVPISEGASATPFLWKDGQLVDLAAATSPATRLHSAFAINGKGQILASRGESWSSGVALLTPR